MPITRDSYLSSPSPLKSELLSIFDPADSLVFFDIGSCEGEDSIKYARLFPNSQIYAVEALPKNLALIRENLVKYNVTNVEVVPFALSDERGAVKFYVSSGQPSKKQEGQDWDYGNKSSSLLPPDKNLEVFPWLKFQDVIDVQSTTLDNVCADHGIDAIDFVHLDVQGAELKVLLGAKKILPMTKVIWLEVETVTLYENQPLKDDIEDFMAKNHFFKLKDTVKRKSGDQLYINTMLMSKKEIMSKVFWNRFSFLRGMTQVFAR